MKRNILFILLLLLITSCKKEILHSISEEQANDIISVLSEYGIDAKKVSDGKGEGTTFNIVVDENDYGRSWSILKENGLPREKTKGLSDVYQRQGLISSSTEEKALLVQAIKGEIERTLETIDSVIRARVIISVPFPSQNPFDESKDLPKASVLLKVKKNSYINKEMIKGILIGAVSSLEKDNINVEIVESYGNNISQSPAMTYIGPFLVLKSSARVFYTFIISTLSILAVVVVLIFLFYYRKRVQAPAEVEEC
ncbi:MAG: hypothetical protein ACPL7I_08430 [Myxococcota bacterium]